MNEHRLARLLEVMGEGSIDNLWVEPSVDFFYLTGIEALSFERLTGLLISADSSMRLLVPLMLEDELAEIADRAETSTWDDASGPETATTEVLEGVDRLFVQGSLPMWAFHALGAASPGTTIELDPGTIGELRERKDPDEMALIRSSGELTDQVVEWVTTQDVSSMTERELAGHIRARYLELGHAPGEWALVASGANASMPHYTGGEVRISPSKPLLTDFGAAVGGYWSDITRVHFPRALDKAIADAYDIVCAAHDAAVAAVGVGVPCRDVDRAARSVIEQAGYGEQFLHRTGHGIGLDVHEPPFITPTNDQLLEIGHVFTIEPGIYVSGRWGLRYENVVYLGEKGAETINKSPRLHYL
jgi:Xaa-Pro aminopeptidase